jgi:hypothetical protein
MARLYADEIHNVIANEAKRNEAIARAGIASLHFITLAMTVNIFVHVLIIVCRNDSDRSRMATRINEAINQEESLTGKLIRVVREGRRLKEPK